MAIIKIIGGKYERLETYKYVDFQEKYWWRCSAASGGCGGPNDGKGDGDNFVHHILFNNDH